MTRPFHPISFSIVLGLGAVIFCGSEAYAQKAAMLFPGSINDQSWNAQGYSGLTRLKELGYETAYSENVPAADHVEAMRDYARRGFNLVIGHSGRFLSAAQRVGPEMESAPATQAAKPPSSVMNSHTFTYNISPNGVCGDWYWRSCAVGTSSRSVSPPQRYEPTRTP